MAINPDPQDLVCDTIDGIGIVPCGRLEDVMYGEDPAQVPEFDQIVRDVRAWCGDHGVSFYGAPGEDFDLGSGVRVAQGEGHRYVVVEDLS